MLRVTNPVRNTDEFTQVKSRLQRMSPAPTTEQVMKQGGAGGQRTGGDTGWVNPQVAWGMSIRRPAATKRSTAGISFAWRCQRTGVSCRGKTR